MMKFKVPFLAAAIVWLMTFMTACSDTDDANSNTGRLSVKMTDAPFPYDLVKEANVTVFKVDARYKGEISSDSTSTHSDSTRFVVLMEKDITINLLELTNGTTETLANAQVPVGNYDLVRVYVKGVNLVLTDGTVFDFKVPSGEQTGIKVFIKPEITVFGGLSGDLLLDFDLSRSFVAKGQGAVGFNFKPVIKACNLTTAGTLAGNVFTQMVDSTDTVNNVPLEGVQVEIYAADTLNTTTMSNEEGNYMIMGLEAGNYDIKALLDGYDPVEINGLEIHKGNTTTQDIEMSTTSGG